MKLGAKHSLEAREKMRLSQLKNPQRYWLGKKRYPETVEKVRKKLIGFKHSNATLKKISLNSKKMWSNFTNQQKIDWANKVRKSMTGEKNHRWKGGITSVSDKIRHSFEYRLWRESVFKRDNWSCLFCGKIGQKLQADHIKPFALFPELRFAIDNGRTLCIKCHKKTNSYGWKINKSFQLELL